MRTFILAVTGLAFAVAACSSYGTSVVEVKKPAQAQVASVSVALASPSLVTGQSQRATAVVRDASGNPLTDRAVSWQSGNPSVATVSGIGDIWAVAPGTAAIMASSEGKTASASLTISAPASILVASVSVSPPSASLQVGASTQLSAVTRDANNSVLTGRPVSWSSGNTGIATVSSVGLVTAVASGAVSITASSEGKSGSAAITVSGPAPAPAPVASVSVTPATSSVQVGGTVQFTAVARDANNNILIGRPTTWSSNNVAVATVSGVGIGTAVAAGSAQITATSEGQTGTAALTVTSPPPPPGGSNEPTGMTAITDRSFNAPNESGWFDSFGSSMTFILDASAPRSPSSVLRATYPAGFSGGEGPGAFDPAPLGNKRTVYIAVWIKHSSNFYGHPSSGVNKIFYLHTSRNDAPVFYLNARGNGTGDLTPEIDFQNTVSEGYSNFGPNLVPSARLVRNQWNKIEVIAVGNTAGSSDGSINVYLNGVHITTKAVQWQALGTTWERLACNPIWGGIGDTVPTTMSLDWDHVYVSGKN